LWYKRHNHLYKDFKFDRYLMEDYIEESAKQSSEFQNIGNEDSDSIRNLDIDSDLSEILDHELDGEIFKRHNLEVHQPIQSSKEGDYTSMFFNKYCEDTNVPTVSNKFEILLWIMRSTETY
jgi:hypothetical protein